MSPEFKTWWATQYINWNIGQVEINGMQNAAWNAWQAALAKPQPVQLVVPCKGMNCGSTDGVTHSAECQAEHAAAIGGGYFVKIDRMKNWVDLIHDNERSMGDRLQHLSSFFGGMLRGDSSDKYPLAAIREQSIQTCRPGDPLWDNEIGE